jgi:hypothetical protein
MADDCCRAPLDRTDDRTPDVGQVRRDHLDTWRATTVSGPGEPLPLTVLAERGRQTWALFLDPRPHP